MMLKKVLKCIMEQQQFINKKQLSNYLQTLDLPSPENDYLALDNIEQIILSPADLQLVDSSTCICSVMIYIRTMEGWICNPQLLVYSIINSRAIQVRGGMIWQPPPFEISEIVAKVKFLPDSLRTYILCHLIIQFQHQVDQLIFRLNPCLSIHRISFNDEELHLIYRDNLNGVLIVAPPSKIPNNKCGVLSVQYSGKPALQNHSHIGSASAIIWNEDGLFPSLNYIPQVRCKYRITYFHPLNLCVCASGKLQSKLVLQNKAATTYFSLTPTHIGGLYIGEYSCCTFEVKKIKVRIYYMNYDQDNLAIIKDRIISCLLYYCNLFGVMPYQELQFCIDSLAMTISNTQSNVVCLSEISIETISHELAHLWWGSYFTCVGPGWRWFHEAFAEFFSRCFCQGISNTCSSSLSNESYKRTLIRLLKSSYIGQADSDYDAMIHPIVELVNTIGYETFVAKCRNMLASYQQLPLHEIIKNLELNVPWEIR